MRAKRLGTIEWIRVGYYDFLAVQRNWASSPRSGRS